MSYCSNEYAYVRAYIFVIANPSLLCSNRPTPYHSSADRDYRNLEHHITFSHIQNSYTFVVQIYNDEEPELPEDFYIDLRIAPEAESRGVRLASPDTAKVVIKDDDSECWSNIQTFTYIVHQWTKSHILNSGVIALVLVLTDSVSVSIRVSVFWCEPFTL